MSATYYPTQVVAGMLKSPALGEQVPITTHRQKRRCVPKEILGNDGGGEAVIHGRDGKIRDSDTVPPGNDPMPPRDKKH